MDDNYFIGFHTLKGLGMSDLEHQMNLGSGQISTGGPRFLVVFGSVLLLIWGIIALAAGTVSSTLGGSGGVADVLAILLWVAAITAMYVAFSQSRHGQVTCGVIAVVTFIIAILLSPGWLIFWLFAGGLIGLAAFLSYRAGAGH